jgi:Ca2+-binding EF-hand superfamily protein
MIAGGGSTTDYWELEKQAKWLGKRGEKQKTRPTYEKVVHNKEWRFYPSKSKGKPIGSTFDSGGYSKALVQEYIERKQRKKRPRTLRPIPFPAKASITNGGQPIQPRLSPPGMMYGRPPQNNMSATFPNYKRGVARTSMTEKLIKKSNLLGVSDVYGHLNSGGSIDNSTSAYGSGGVFQHTSDSGYMDEYNQVKDNNRWVQHQSVIEEAVTSQLRRYKAENRALRKQKRATLYILRLLEQKILDLNGSNTQVEPIDPTAAGYEMHPEVYSILKGETDAQPRPMVAVNANDVNTTETQNALVNPHGKENENEANISNDNITITSNVETRPAIVSNITITSKDDNVETRREEEEALTKEGEIDETKASANSTEIEMVSEEILESKEKLKQIFLSLDSSGNGSLSKREFRRAIFKRPDLGQFITIANFQKTFENMDTDKNGSLTYIEFEEYCLKSLRLKDQETKDKTNMNCRKDTGYSGRKLMQVELRAIFDSLDVNKNGTLEKKEFKKAIMLSPELGKFLKIVSFDASFKRIDTNHDTLITYDEFENFCLQDIVHSLEEIEDPYAADRMLLQSIFADLDANSNSLLEKREFRRAVQRRPELGSFLRPKQFLNSFKAMDISKDGGISLDEFVSFCINAKYKYLDEEPALGGLLPPMN